MGATRYLNIKVENSIKILIFLCFTTKGHENQMALREPSMVQGLAHIRAIKAVATYGMTVVIAEQFNSSTPQPHDLMEKQSFRTPARTITRFFGNDPPFGSSYSSPSLLHQVKMKRSGSDIKSSRERLIQRHILSHAAPNLTNLRSHEKRDILAKEKRKDEAAEREKLTYRRTLKTSDKERPVHTESGKILLMRETLSKQLKNRPSRKELEKKKIILPLESVFCGYHEYHGEKFNDLEKWKGQKRVITKTVASTYYKKANEEGDRWFFASPKSKKKNRKRRRKRSDSLLHLPPDILISKEEEEEEKMRELREKERKLGYEYLENCDGLLYLDNLAVSFDNNKSPTVEYLMDKWEELGMDLGDDITVDTRRKGKAKRKDKVGGEKEDHEKERERKGGVSPGRKVKGKEKEKEKDRERERERADSAGEAENGLVLSWAIESPRPSGTKRSPSNSKVVRRSGQEANTWMRKSTS